MTASYWVERGKTYVRRFHPGLVYQQQEEALRHLLAVMQPTSILELGCGFGRMTTLANEAKPERYRAIDVSPDQLAVAKTASPGIEFIEADILDYETEDRFDLVFSSEVLMHVHPGDIGSLVAKTVRWSSRYILNIDLAYWDGPLASHNWVHDYPGLYAPLRPMELQVGRYQALFVVDKEAT